jgi:hypothetical protein
MLRFSGNLLGVLGASALLFAAPVGIFIGITGTCLHLISNFLKSEEQKRREAVENIRNSLNKQFKSELEKALKNAEDSFNKYSKDVESNISDYFNELIANLEQIIKHLENTQNKLDGCADNLNRAYAKRIVDWCADKYEPLTDEGILTTIAQVDRDFGRNIKIQTKSEFKSKRFQKIINQVLQEDISIISVKSSEQTFGNIQHKT